MSGVSTVFFNGKFVAQPTTGVQRFSRELITAADRLIVAGRWRTEARLVLLVPGGHADRLPRLSCFEVREVPATRLHVWEQLQLPRATGGQLLVNLSGSAPLFKRNQICTFHDAAIFDIPQAYSGMFGSWYRFLFRTQGPICRRVLTVSEFSKARLAHHLRIDAARIGVVPNGADHAAQPQDNGDLIERHQLRPGHYFLAVGSDNPSKNFASLMAAFSRLDRPDVQLVVVGGSNQAVFAGAGASTATADPRIVRTGRVSDSQLMALYRQALAFVFPSLYEGFGIPPLEAMRAGCPVLAANAASIPEVCGDAADYFDPHSVDDIAASLTRALDQPERLALLREAGHARVAHFTWDHAACLLLQELGVLGIVHPQPQASGPAAPAVPR